VQRLSREEVDRLLSLDAYGTTVRNPGCLITDPEPLGERAYAAGPSPGDQDEAELRERIAAIVRETLDGGRT
jgi:hypothetical protein